MNENELPAWFKPIWELAKKGIFIFPNIAMVQDENMAQFIKESKEVSK